MEELKLGVVEMQFAEIIWERAPLSSGVLVKLSAERLNWKKSTTYTVLKKLCERGFFENCEGQVKVLVTRDEYEARQTRQFVAETFDGSLPAFLAAFTKQKSLSAEEIAEIRRMIDGMEGG